MVTRRSAKNKGMRFQKEVAEIIRTKFNLEERDVVSTPSSVQGVDILLSEKAKKLFPYAVECKNKEQLSIWRVIEQAESNVEKGLDPLIIFTKNRRKNYVCLELDKFMRLLK